MPTYGNQWNIFHKRRRRDKASKREVLRFIKKRGAVTPLDLMEEFGYRHWGASDRLYELRRQGLVERLTDERGSPWILSVQGERRVDYYDRQEERERR